MNTLLNEWLLLVSPKMQNCSCCGWFKAYILHALRYKTRKVTLQRVYYVFITRLTLAKHRFAKIIKCFVLWFKRAGENWTLNNSSFMHCSYTLITLWTELEIYLTRFALDPRIKISPCYQILLSYNVGKSWPSESMEINLKDPLKPRTSGILYLIKKSRRGSSHVVFIYLFVFHSFPNGKNKIGRRYWVQVV